MLYIHSGLTDHVDVNQAIEARRSYRAYLPMEITPTLIEELGKAVQLMPSCFNNQPWRVIFAYNSEELQRIKEEPLSPGNSWAKASSLIIAVLSKRDLDCIVQGREYFLFDTGMAAAALQLRAVDLGLDTHCIAGYSPEKVREIFQIPEEYVPITLICCGQHNPEIPAEFTPEQREAEMNRPARKPLNEIIFQNRFG